MAIGFHTVNPIHPRRQYAPEGFRTALPLWSQLTINRPVASIGGQVQLSLSPLT